MNETENELMPLTTKKTKCGRLKYRIKVVCNYGSVWYVVQKRVLFWWWGIDSYPNEKTAQAALDALTKFNLY